LAEDPAHRPGDAAEVLAELAAAAADRSGPPVGEFDDFRDLSDREPARRVGDRFFADWENPDAELSAPAPAPPATRSWHGRVVGAAAALAVLVAVPVLAGRQPAPLPGSARPSEVAVPAESAAGFVVRTEGTVELELDPPVEAGDAVELTWRSDTDLEYAVVVAGAAMPTKVVMVKRQRTLRMPVDPARQYCFLVQGTDGEHVYQTAPRPIRGATCRL
jgi:hypothetical protein